MKSAIHPFRIKVPGTDDVTFHNCNEDVYKKIGALIYNAATDAQSLKDLQDNAAGMLTAAGVPPSSIQGKKLDVIRDDPSLLNITVPEVKARGEFATPADFDQYLLEIGFVTIRACKG